MASPLASILKAIQKLAPSPHVAEVAASRASTLPEVIDVSRYSPQALARSTLQVPAAQRGFSESIVSQKPPVASFLMRPSEFLERTPPLDTVRDARILEQLTPSIQKQKLKDLPLLWADEYPTGIDLGYEGRHRMSALQQLYGDDPVLMNLIQGDRFNMVNSPYYSHPVREYASPATLSPLEMLRQQMMFGDSPVKINPLWVKE
jgi:hypothetical protein